MTGATGTPEAETDADTEPDTEPDLGSSPNLDAGAAATVATTSATPVSDVRAVTSATGGEIGATTPIQPTAEAAPALYPRDEFERSLLQSAADQAAERAVLGADELAAALFMPRARAERLLEMLSGAGICENEGQRRRVIVDPEAVNAKLTVYLDRANSELVANGPQSTALVEDRQRGTVEGRQL